MPKDDETTPAQHGVGDMDPREFRAAAHRTADHVANYLEGIEERPVFPDIEPGSIREQLPAGPPEQPEPLDRIFEDYTKLIEPNITHWQHPGFMAYFPSTASGPGILGEWLATGLNSNVMFWKNAPASTELEEVVVSWLRQMLGLPDAFDGMFTDTASISSLLSLVVARHVVPGLDSHGKGLAGRPDVGPLRLYVSAESHVSIEKAAVVVGVGREGVVRVETDEAYRMRPEALARAIEEDRRAGMTPFCVVGTLGTTSSTSFDPAGALADICEREKLWLHLDAAYGGAAALAPEFRTMLDGWERADSIVVNPHKMMFTPFDASLLLFRDPATFREAFCMTSAGYLAGAATSDAVHNYNEYGVQLGRRFRALKLWMQIRYFGAAGYAERMRAYARRAQEFAGWVESEADWDLVTPVTFTTVCLRFRPEAGETSDEEIDRINERILERVNASGKVYLSGTRLSDRYTLRVALGHPRSTPEHVRECWRLLREAARASSS